MKKLTLLIAPLLLLTPIMFIDLTPEDDEITVTTVENALLYEVYKIDITTRSEPSPNNAVHIVYFDIDDSEGKREFEEALKNKDPLPQGLDITWNDTIRKLTAYVFGYPVTMYSGDYSDAGYFIIEEKYIDGVPNTNYSYKYILDKHKLEGASSNTKIIGGQTVKVTIDDAPSGVPLVFYSADCKEKLEDYENYVEVTAGGYYAVYGDSWTGSSLYVSYTIEHIGLPSEVSEYGKFFFGIGVLFLAVMLWAARPQRIRK